MSATTMPSVDVEEAIRALRQSMEDSRSERHCAAADVLGRTCAVLSRAARQRFLAMAPYDRLIDALNVVASIVGPLEGDAASLDRVLRSLGTVPQLESFGEVDAWLDGFAEILAMLDAKATEMYVVDGHRGAPFREALIECRERAVVRIVQDAFTGPDGAVRPPVSRAPVSGAVSVEVPC